MQKRQINIYITFHSEEDSDISDLVCVTHLAPHHVSLMEHKIFTLLVFKQVTSENVQFSFPTIHSEISVICLMNIGTEKLTSFQRNGPELPLVV